MILEWFQLNDDGFNVQLRVDTPAELQRIRELLKLDLEPTTTVYVNLTNSLLDRKDLHAKFHEERDDEAEQLRLVSE